MLNPLVDDKQSMRELRANRSASKLRRLIADGACDAAIAERHARTTRLCELARIPPPPTITPGVTAPLGLARSGVDTARNLRRTANNAVALAELNHAQRAQPGSALGKIAGLIRREAAQ